MSKSRYSKTKAAGAAVGVSRYGKLFNQRSNAPAVGNRMTRRAEGRKSQK